VTVTDHERAARLADSQQAEYFRAELNAERELLLTEIGKRRALIDHPGDAERRLRRAVQSSEAQLRYLDRLIAGLDSRFGSGTPQELDDRSAASSVREPRSTNNGT
jgi:hypothetical protein